MVTELVAILKDTNSSFREWLYTRDFLLRNKHFGVNLFISTEKKKKIRRGEADNNNQETEDSDDVRKHGRRKTLPDTPLISSFFKKSSSF